MTTKPPIIVSLNAQVDLAMTDRFVCLTVTNVNIGLFAPYKAIQIKHGNLGKCHTRKNGRPECHVKISPFEVEEHLSYNSNKVEIETEKKSVKFY